MIVLKSNVSAASSTAISWSSWFWFSLTPIIQAWTIQMASGSSVQQFCFICHYQVIYIGPHKIELISRFHLAQWFHCPCIGHHCGCCPRSPLSALQIKLLSVILRTRVPGWFRTCLRACFRFNCEPALFNWRHGSLIVITVISSIIWFTLERLVGPKQCPCNFGIRN